MRKLHHLLPAALLAATAAPAFSNSAPQAVTDTMVVECVHETRAPGSYEVIEHSEVIEIRATPTGTVRGLNDVSDCLKDKMQLQYGASHKVAGAWSGAATTAPGCYKGAPPIMGGASYCIGPD